MCGCVAWMGSSQPRWVWKYCLPRHGGAQLLHWHNRCCMDCCQRLHPQLVVFTKIHKAKIFSCTWKAGKGDMWIIVNLHTHLQRKTISTLKSLLWKEEKRKRVYTLRWNQCKTHTKFANLAKFGFRKWQFRCGKKKNRNSVFTRTVSGPARCM